MLARPEFMLAEDLGTTEVNRAALIEVLKRLESGELRHDPHYEKTRFIRTALVSAGWVQPKDMFNMSTWRSFMGCGTAFCIGGYAESLGADFSQVFSIRDNERQKALMNLFYVNDGRPEGGDLNDVTAEQAARALRNYLTTGKARWDEVLA